jgi:hypothetical protein
MYSLEQINSRIRFTIGEDFLSALPSPERRKILLSIFRWKIASGKIMEKKYPLDSTVSPHDETKASTS